MKRTVNGATNYYIYDGEKPILQYKASGVIVARNLYGKGIDEILMRTDYVINQTYYFQDDAFGAPTIYSASGMAIKSTAYGNRFLFTGREYDSTFGIYEYRNRAYHPGLGRFMSEDPKGFAAGDYNLFRYCHNDPEDLTDPMGLLMGVYQVDPRPPPPPPSVWSSHIPQPFDQAQKNLIMGQTGQTRNNETNSRSKPPEMPDNIKKSGSTATNKAIELHYADNYYSVGHKPDGDFGAIASCRAPWWPELSREASWKNE